MLNNKLTFTYTLVIDLLFFRLYTSFFFFFEEKAAFPLILQDSKNIIIIHEQTLLFLFAVWIAISCYCNC